MGMIWGILAALGATAAAILAGALSRQVADEFKAWSPWLTGRLLKCATKRLPENIRDRYGEEWASHVAETPGELGKLVAACGIIFASFRMSSLSTPFGLRSIFLRPLDSDRHLISEILSLLSG
jgi:hypothetical protein